MASMLSRISRSCDFGSLKGKRGVSEGLIADGFFHGIGGREIDFGSEEVGEAIFKMDHGDEREAPGAVEVSHEVDVRGGRGFIPSDRSEKAQVDDAGGFQLRLVRAKGLNYGMLVHDLTLT